MNIHPWKYWFMIFHLWRWKIMSILSTANGYKCCINQQTLIFNSGAKCTFILKVKLKKGDLIKSTWETLSKCRWENIGKLKGVHERTDEQWEEDILKKITNVAEQESNLTTIQSAQGIDGNLGGEYVQVGSSRYTVPELPASCLLFRSAHTHTHAHAKNRHTPIHI